MTAAFPFGSRAPRIAAALIAVTLAVATVVRIAWAEAAQTRLAFAFAGLPARADTAATIFTGNARLLLAVIALALLLQSRWCRAAGGARSPLGCVVIAACDALVALTVSLNLVLVGAALGAYGSRMVAAILPHGPFELVAYALALALYLRAREQAPLRGREIMVTAVSGLGALAVAAVLETYVAL